MIDVCIPRELVYREFEEHPGPCPRCGGPLQSHTATYLVATMRGKKDADSFFIGNDMGWFCARCPTVVINPEEVSKFLLYGKPGWDTGTEFAVLGIVDLNAIPEEKRNVLLGEDENPIPLVRFTSVTREAAPRRTTGPSRAVASRPAAPVRDRDGGRFEERYEDVLQNIEFGIVQVYRSHPKMTDWEALSAVEALVRVYNAEAKGREITPPSLVPLAEEVYGSVKMMCEWRLGRETPFQDEGAPVDLPVELVSLDEIVACLKRVRKSINRWSRDAGRQGYLTFVSQFIA